MVTPCSSFCPSSQSLPSWRETGLFLVSKWQDVLLLLWAFAWMVPFDIGSSPWLCPARSSGFQFSCPSGAIISQAQDWARLSASTAHSTHPMDALVCRLAIICLLLTSTSHQIVGCLLSSWLHLNQSVTQCHPLNVYKHVKLSISHPKISTAPPPVPSVHIPIKAPLL